MPCSLVSYVTACRRNILSESSTLKPRQHVFTNPWYSLLNQGALHNKNDVMFKLYLKLKFLIQENTLPFHYKVQLITSLYRNNVWDLTTTTLDAFRYSTPYNLVGQFQRVGRHAVCSLKFHSTIMRIEAFRSSETLVYIYQTLRRRIPKAYLNSSLFLSYTKHTLVKLERSLNVIADGLYSNQCAAKG